MAEGKSNLSEALSSGPSTKTMNKTLVKKKIPVATLEK